MAFYEEREVREVVSLPALSATRRLEENTMGSTSSRPLETVATLVVFAEEARVEADTLGHVGLGDDLVDAAVEPFARGWIHDRAVKAESHGSLSGSP